MNPKNFVRVGDFVVPRRVEWHFAGDKGDPDLSAVFEFRDGRPMCVDVCVSASAGGRQVRSADLLALEVDKMTVVAFSRFTMRSVFNPETNVTTTVPVDDEREVWAAINGIEAAVKAPRRGVTQAELERVAEIYLANIATEPALAVMVQMGYGSQRTAHRRIKQAETAGLLPATTPGKRRV